jgi:putative oxidoreductase
MRNASFPVNALGAEFKEKLRANFLLSGLAILLGAALGAVFFYAGLQKHLAPFQFAEAVMAYRLLPQSQVGLVAAVLPWVELTAGFFLVLGYLLEAAGRIAMSLGLSSGALLVGGIKRRSCLLLVGALAFLFVIVMLVTLARGLEIDCGCGLFFQRQVGPVPLVENILLLLAAAALYWWEYAGG